HRAIHAPADRDPLRPVDFSADQRADEWGTLQRHDERLLPVVGVRLPQLQRGLYLSGGGAVLCRVWCGRMDFHLAGGSIFLLRRMNRLSARLISSHGVLLLLSVMTLFPLYWMLLTSLRPPNEIVSADLMPARLTLDNYVAVWREIPIARMLLNTLLMSVLV